MNLIRGIKTFYPIQYEYEEWLPVTLFNIVPNRYLVSNLGRVYSYFNDRILELHTNNKGYKGVKLNLTVPTPAGYDSTIIKLHRLVLGTFNPISNMHLYEVNHKDGNKSNNCLYNLEWATPKENTAHAFKTNLRSVLYGDQSAHHVFTESIVREICTYMEQGLSNKNIADIIMNNYNDYKQEQVVSLISRIRNRSGWFDIVNEYSY